VRGCARGFYLVSRRDQVAGALRHHRRVGRFGLNRGKAHEG
jgi:hypothetical protein